MAYPLPSPQHFIRLLAFLYKVRCQNHHGTGSLEKLYLRWNDFESNLSGMFRELIIAKDFFNVTLACDDDQKQAHKVILSACSPFIRNHLESQQT